MLSKITLTLEFDSFEELIEYFKKQEPDEQAKILEQMDVGKREFFAKKAKSKRWTQFEDEFIIGNFATKNAKWIAHQLQRTPASVSMRVDFIRRSGIPIPMKKNKNGKVNVFKDGKKIS